MNGLMVIDGHWWLILISKLILFKSRIRWSLHDVVLAHMSSRKTSGFLGSYEVEACFWLEEKPLKNMGPDWRYVY